MVSNDADFEATLRQADAVLDSPPAEGTPEFERLAALLADIAAYRPNISKPAEEPVASERARLAAQLEAFESRVRRNYRTYWLTLIGENFLYK